MFPWVYLARKLWFFNEDDLGKQDCVTAQLDETECDEYREGAVEDDDEKRHNNENNKMNPGRNLKHFDFLLKFLLFVCFILLDLQFEKLPILHL